MVDLRLKFLVPSTFGEDVVIASTVTEFKRSSFEVHHRLLRGEELAVEGFETRVWTVFDPERPGRLKSRAVPDEVRAAFAKA
jgi:4-hydroxybenzoyl-CoA thioesterase